MIDEEKELERELRGAAVSFTVRSIDDYLKTMEAAVAHIQQQAGPSIDEADLEDTSVDWENYYRFLAEQHESHVFQFVPFMLWNNTFVAIVSLLEEEIVELALEQHAKRSGHDSPVRAFQETLLGDK